MADPFGFLKHRERELPKRRPVSLRLQDWKEVYEEFSHEALRTQASRCMDYRDAWTVESPSVTTAAHWGT